MDVYILKTIACMFFFLLFYKLLLEQENMHVFKRFYLLGALTASFIIPSIVFVTYIEPVVSNTDFTAQIIEPNTAPVNTAPRDIDVINFPLIFLTIYLMGVLGFGIRFGRNLVQIVKRIQNNPKLKSNSITNVLLQEKIVPHTFFRYVFLNKTTYESKEIPNEVLLHEETHAKQRHSYDVLFIELLQVIFWFNPLLYFFKKAIKLNHEFLADHAVLTNNINTSTYQNTLLSYLSPDSAKKYQSLANAINYSSTRLTVFGKTVTLGPNMVGQVKKRFKIMKTHTSKKGIIIRNLLLIPLIAMLFYSFTETKTITKVSESKEVISGSDIKITINSEKEIYVDGKKTQIGQISSQIVKIRKARSSNVSETSIQLEFDGNLDLELLGLVKKQIEVSGSNLTMITADTIYAPDIILREEYKGVSFSVKDTIQVEMDNGKLITGTSTKSQKGASRKLMAEYNKLAKYYNDMPKRNMKVLLKDLKRLEYIYSLMSKKQRADAEPFPDFPDPPKAPKAPKQAKAPKEPKQSKAPKSPKQVKTPKVKKGEKSDIAPPPPPLAPKSPLDHVIDMAKKDAIFMFEGKEISSDKAIELLKKNDNINISSKGKRGGKPQVFLSRTYINKN